MDRTDFVGHERRRRLPNMTRRRFFAPPEAFNSHRDSVTLSTDEARYLREVLRLRAGAEVFVFNGEGKEFACTVEESRRDSARLKVNKEVEPARPESVLDLQLAIALLKGEKFDLVVQKATELGVARIIPAITKHADIRLRDESDATKRAARWQRIALEAAKQSGRTVVPEIANVVTFSDLIQRPVSVKNFMFSERGGEPSTNAFNIDPNLKSLTALVGPEGGWADEELAAAKQAGWTLITLGGRTLRAETAAIAVTALLQHQFGDLR